MKVNRPGFLVSIESCDLLPEDTFIIEGLVAKFSSSIGKENCYVCATCQGIIRTVDKDNGVTPMMLLCNRYGRGKVGCIGQAVSRMYRPELFPTAHPNWPSRVTHEWYKPSDEEIAAMNPEFQDHYKRGGLAIRERLPE